MRQTIKEVETNLAYRWFLGLSLIDKVPHFSTFGKNYARRFRETNLFEQIFIIILEQAVDARFIHEAILYQKQLEEEINEVRIAEGKRPFCSIIRQEVVERKISVAEKRLLCKKRTRKTVCLFYSYRLR
ncbi:transposase [Enterococcus pernyi]